MADDNTPTASTTVKPLTAAEQAQRDELNRRAALTDWQATEDARKSKLASMPNLDAFTSAVTSGDLGKKLTDALTANEPPSLEMRQSIDRIQQCFGYDVAKVVDFFSALRTETPKPGETPTT